MGLVSCFYRTHTLLLIDAKNCCEYVEKTIVDYSDVANPIWKTVTHSYQLNQTNWMLRVELMQLLEASAW